MSVLSWLHRTRSAEDEVQKLLADAANVPAEDLARAVFRTVSLANRYRLVVVGPCRMCGRQAQSKPIRTAGHLTDLLRTFQVDPRTHKCPSVIERLARLDRW